MLDFIGNVIVIVTGIVTVASLIAAATDTPKDDELIGKLYKLVDILALNIGTLLFSTVNQSTIVLLAQCKRPSHTRSSEKKLPPLSSNKARVDWMKAAKTTHCY